MIYIGAIFGGPEGFQLPVARAISRLERLRDVGGDGNSGSVDVVFHVAGSLLQPEHVGVRTGRLSRKRRMLQVQIAVPAEVASSEDSYPLLLAWVREALTIAGPRFRRAGIPYPEEEYLGWVERLAQMDVH